jgi:N-acetylglucosaminyldiphosphoundecaprenol N-acetyl-beta-D-mannosaminyltransferase
MRIVTEAEKPASEVARVWGLPLVAWSRSRAIDEIDRLIAARRPSYFITANVHYAMLSAERPELAAVNEGAAFVVADGAPLVWASRRRGTPLPERVTGSDLIFDLCEMAARRDYGLFLLGGGPGVADTAAARLAERHPGLRVVGTYCPPFRELTAIEREELIGHVQKARPDLLLTAYTMPRGELWLAEHHKALGVPVCANIGAAIDFAAGRVRRAPKWMQRSGLEWAFRISTDPARLAPRYAQNAGFLARAVLRDLTGRGPGALG